MVRDTSEHERRNADIPTSVRCRRDPDGIVVWVPEDQTDRRPPARDTSTERRQTGSAQVDQG